MIVLDLSILNQKGTPMFNSDLTANRPAAGIVGRIFIATDSPYGIFRDTGTGWDQVSSAGGGATIYSGDGTLTGNRTISSGGFNLTFAPQTTFSSSLTAATGGSSYSVLGSNTLSYAVGFSSSNIGNVYGANGAINLQNFLGNATFAQANLASANVSVNSIDFGSGGHTITMTQSTGIRAMTGHQSQIQFQGSHNGTISHAAVSQNLGFYRAVGSTRTLTITNAYSLLLNALDDYGAGFTFTNRWGIYQAGASDTNYFAANSLFGTTVNAGFRVDINGTARVSGDLTIRDSGSSSNVFIFSYNATTSCGTIEASTTGIAYRNIVLNPNNSSNVGIGIVPTRKLDVNGTSRYLGEIFVNAASASTTTQLLYLKNSTANSTGAVSQLTLFRDGSSGISYGSIVRFNQKAYSNPNSASFTQLDITMSDGATESADTTPLSIRGTGIGINNTSPNASAMLDVTSSTKGFLPPRMTNAQRTAISSPAVGLIVYCTDTVEGLYIYKSTGWTFVI